MFGFNGILNIDQIKSLNEKRQIARWKRVASRFKGN